MLTALRFESVSVRMKKVMRGDTTTGGGGRAKRFCQREAVCGAAGISSAWFVATLPVFVCRSPPVMLKRSRAAKAMDAAAL